MIETTNILSIAGLGLRRSNRWVLRNVAIDILPGTVVALVGPNGSGKSTLLRCAAGLWQPTEGSVMIECRNIQDMPRPRIARCVTYVPQEAHLDFDFTIREIVLMGRYSHRGRFERDTQEDRQAAEDAMMRTDVMHLAERPVTQLSGGERQRVLIARSLATQANVLLLDEPTANLDVDHGLEVLELCRSLADEGRAVVIAMHDLNAVCRYADQVALMDEGRLIALGDSSSVLTPENLERAFHVRSEALASVDGSPFLLFHRLTQDIAAVAKAGRT